ncbi:UNVERIFIED_CONTAM: hypothetical protein Sradi_1695800 [Sesamum radiatum]|uniref:Uncharacterized protein n=1 Tax=Sesamum radiatum TaxID=300843 RepID=A0AAW2TT46_SESRA
MKTHTNAQGKQKAGETPIFTTQALQIVSSTSLTPILGLTTTTTPRPANPAADPPMITISPDAPFVELYSNLLGTIQQMIASAIREQLAILVPTRMTTSSEVTAPEQADLAPAAPRLNNVEGQTTQLLIQMGDIPPQRLARLECLQKGLQDVQYQVMGAPSQE